MLNPVALSIIANTFRSPERAQAVGIWGLSVAGILLPLGPLIGGALTQTVGWRSIFLDQCPIGLAAANVVAGMPLSQAGVAAAIASTGRQVGAGGAATTVGRGGYGFAGFGL